ncbi:hypothetical protein GCM10027053_20330 [Intrasporangium mesophilum]
MDPATHEGWLWIAGHGGLAMEGWLWRAGSGGLALDGWLLVFASGELGAVVGMVAASRSLDW